MRYISHRGNLNGKEANENTLAKIISCIRQGFDVEVDIWSINNELFLGHDYGQNFIDLDILKLFNERLWIHCKNIEALHKLLESGLDNLFFHNVDDCTLTSNGLIWTFPGKELTSKSICVLPEKANYSIESIRQCYGVCSDEIIKYKGLI